MTEQQKQAFEAFALLRAHTVLFSQVVENGTVEDMQAQLQQVQDALNRVASIPALAKAA